MTGPVWSAVSRVIGNLAVEYGVSVPWPEVNKEIKRCGLDEDTEHEVRMKLWRLYIDPGPRRGDLVRLDGREGEITGIYPLDGVNRFMVSIRGWGEFTCNREDLEPLES